MFINLLNESAFEHRSTLDKLTSQQKHDKLNKVDLSTTKVKEREKKLKIHACNTLERTNEQKITREKKCREREREREGILRGCTLLNTTAHVNS